VLWTLRFKEGVDSTLIAEKIARGLLSNEHYQKFVILG